MDLALKGRVALVTASSKGLGKAIALGLAREGARVAICARDEAEVKAAAAEIASEAEEEPLALVADVSAADAAGRLVSATVARFGGLDVLVTNAGGPPSGEFAQHGDEAWEKAFQLNLQSVVRLVREALPYLKAGGRGRIINMSSTAVKEPIDRLVLSNSIRAGVIGLAKTLSTELAPFGITANNVAPGRIDTGRIRQLDQASAQSLGISEEEARSRQMARIPLGRYGTPEEVANLVVFLASDRASYMTGTTIQVDGGMVKGIV